MRPLLVFIPSGRWAIVMGKEAMPINAIEYVERFFLRTIVVAGVVLVCCSYAALYSIDGLLFQALWMLHLLVQVVAVLAGGFLLYRYAGFAERAKWPYVLVLVSILGVLSVYSILPITARDSLIYHLTTPKRWLAAGHMTELSWLEWSYFPLLMSVGYAGFLYYGLEQLTPFYHGGFLICGAALAGLAIRGKVKATGPILAAVLVLTLPLFFRLGFSPMADLATVVYFAVAFVLFDRYLRSTSHSNELLLCGASLGLCMSTKYNSLLIVAVIAPIWFLWAYSTLSDFRKACLSLIAIFCVAGTIFLIWPIRNYLWTGNPFYPFLNELFLGDGQNVAFMGGMQPLVYRRDVYGEGMLDLLLIPLRIFFLGADDIPQKFDGVLNPVLILGALAFLPRVRKGERWIHSAGAFVILYFLFAIFLFHALARYWAPAIWLLILLAVTVIDSFRVLRHPGVIGGIALFCLWQFGSYVTDLGRKLGLVSYLSGAESHEGYLTKRVPDFKIAQFANAHIPMDMPLYLLFTGNRYYYYEGDVRGSYSSGDVFLRWIRESRSPGDISASALNSGLRYVALLKPLTDKAFRGSLTKEEYSLWHRFLTTGLLVVSEDESVIIGRIVLPNS